jgi:acetyltransferase-like isoleucine patch superfamily enzyme
VPSETHSETLNPRDTIRSHRLESHIPAMSKIYSFLARSQHPLAREARRLYHRMEQVSLPAPGPLVKPAMWAFLGLRSAYHFGARVFVAEPLMKGYCKSYGKNFHTGSSVHWVQGKGDLIVGDDVLIDGMCNITFASTISDHPTLRIGDRTMIGHGAALVVARQITIGADCLIAGGVRIFDSPGHPSDPEPRRARQRPSDEDVRPVVVEDNVWIGVDAVIAPGVRVGEGSIVSAKSVVLNDVPAYTVVMGNPARRILQLKPTTGTATAPTAP